MLSAAVVEALDATSAAACQRLSAAAGWSHSLADWQVRLTFGQGLGVRRGGILLACGLLSPGAGEAAFLGMLLTDPAARGQGHAAAIIDAVLALCRHGGRRAWLIAVPRALPLYRRLGFHAVGAVLSHRGPAVLRPARPVRRATAADLPQLLALDAAAWGGERAPLIRDQFARFPQYAFVADGADGPIGFALAADRGDTRTLGPVVTAATDIATSLAAAALAGAVQARCDSLAQHHAFHATLGMPAPLPLPLMAFGTERVRLPFANPSLLFAAQSAAAG